MKNKSYHQPKEKFDKYGVSDLSICEQLLQDRQKKQTEKCAATKGSVLKEAMVVLRNSNIMAPVSVHYSKVESFNMCIFCNIIWSLEIYLQLVFSSGPRTGITWNLLFGSDYKVGQCCSICFSLREPPLEKKKCFVWTVASTLFFWSLHINCIFKKGPIKVFC